MITVLVSFLQTLRGLIQSRAALHLEVLALRHQLQVLQRTRPRRVLLATADRGLWVWLSRVWTAWRTALIIVKLEVIGSLRRECLDHVIVWNERSLRRHLGQYLTYYHAGRTRLSLDKDAPVPRTAAQPPTCGAVVQVPHLGGLHHHYERRAA